LTLARADAGRLELRHRPLDLRDVVGDCVGQCRPLAESQGLKLALKADSVVVRGDARRLAQVVTNLLSNAVRYNRPGGSVKVRVRVDGAWAVLLVADTGPGIAESDRPHVFERFFRADKSRGSGGAGLGLAICKSIVAAHGGEIRFSSEDGVGT